MVLSILGGCLVCRLPVPHHSLHTFSWLLYREDFLKLGLTEKATKEEIKAAYFEKAKQLHPDSQINQCKITENEFLELNEYRRVRVGGIKFEQTTFYVRIVLIFVLKIAFFR